MSEQSTQSERKDSLLFPTALLGLCLGLVSAGAMMLGALGSRWGWWHFSTGLSVLRYGAYGGLAAAVVSLINCLLMWIGAVRRGLTWAIVGIVMGSLTVGVPWSWSRQASVVPLIHDITTDWDNPPRFHTIAPLRRDSPNPVEYGGSEIATQQRQAYPDIRTLVFQLPPEEAFERALTAVRQMGWEIVETNPQERRIEATDTTFWFGFKDDVVVRITPVNSSSRIDVRSVSRVGRSDVGTNARRIRAFLNQVQNK